MKIDTVRADNTDKIIASGERNTILKSLTEIAIMKPAGTRGKASLLLNPMEFCRPFLIDSKPNGSVGARRLIVITNTGFLLWHNEGRILQFPLTKLILCIPFSDKIGG
jgi:hypothetical protein